MIHQMFQPFDQKGIVMDNMYNNAKQLLGEKKIIYVQDWDWL